MPRRLLRMWIALSLLVALVLAAEIAARLYGLGRPLLYEKTAYGYRVAPAQDLKRFGNRVFYNRYGMRSEEIAAHPEPGTLRVLCLGDSITFGGTATDQPDTYPYRLAQALAARGGGERYEVLNVSAGGWAIENEAGWLAAHGLFGSRVVVLQLATHDLFQRMAASGLVGTHPSFPERRPLFALQELVMRYALPRLSSRIAPRGPDDAVDPADRHDVARTMAVLERIARLVQSADARLFVMLVEQPPGIEPDDELTRHAKAALEAKAAELRVPLIRPAAALEAAGGARVFMDAVHPNAEGNRVIASEVALALLEGQGVPALEGSIAAAR